MAAISLQAPLLGGGSRHSKIHPNEMLKTTVKILLYLAALAVWATFGAFATIGVRLRLSPLTPIVETLATNALLLTWLAFPVTCAVAVFSGRLRGLVLFLLNLGLWFVFLMCVLVLDRNV